MWRHTTNINIVHYEQRELCLMYKILMGVYGATYLYNFIVYGENMTIRARFKINNSYQESRWRRSYAVRCTNIFSRSFHVRNLVISIFFYIFLYN